MAVGERKAQKRRGMAQEVRRKARRRGLFEKEEWKMIMVGVARNLIKYNFIKVYIYFEYWNSSSKNKNNIKYKEVEGAPHSNADSSRIREARWVAGGILSLLKQIHIKLNMYYNYIYLLKVNFGFSKLPHPNLYRAILINIYYRYIVG